MKLTSTNIALINMPCAPVRYPSLAVGILKSILLQKGHEVNDKYLNLSFANYIGIENFFDLPIFRKSLFGDWLFSRLAFNMDTSKEYFQEIHSLETSEDFTNLSDLIETALEMRDKAENWFLEIISEKNNWEQFDIFAFSCTFSQTVSSIALAKYFKKKWPHKKVIFGGSAFDGDMGLEFSRNFYFADCIVQGAGEHAFLELLELIKNEKNIPKIYRSEIPIDLNELPIPNYDTYYKIIRGGEVSNEENIFNFGALSIETSRGCWWGQKQQCEFCGVNGESLDYKAKNPDKILKEIDELSRKYKRYTFFVNDTIIGPDFYSTIASRLSVIKSNYQFFLEIKSNTTFDKLKNLKDAGVLFIQPGIETLNTSILKLMNKGVRSSQNLDILRWSKKLGILCSWNLIYGLPDEEDSSYVEMIELIKLIPHLQPPMWVGQIVIERFSPLFKKIKEKSLLVPNFQAAPAYKHCFPADWNREKIAYSFSGELQTRVSRARYKELIDLVKDWQSRWENLSVEKQEPYLIFKRGLSFGHILDARFGNCKTIEIDGDYLLVADTLEKGSMAIKNISEQTGLCEIVVEKICETYVEAKIAVKCDERIVWLPIGPKVK